MTKPMSPEERAAHVAAAEAGPFGQSKAVTALLRELARVTAERDGRLEQALSDVEDLQHALDQEHETVRQITRERDEARHVMRASWEDAKARYVPEVDAALAQVKSVYSRLKQINNCDGECTTEEPCSVCQKCLVGLFEEAELGLAATEPKP